MAIGYLGTIALPIHGKWYWEILQLKEKYLCLVVISNTNTAAALILLQEVLISYVSVHGNNI